MQLIKFNHILRIAVLSFAFLIFSQNVFAQDTACSENFDQRLFRKLNGHRTSFLDLTIPVTEKPITFPSLLYPTTLFVSSKATGNYYDENSSALMTVAGITNLALTYGMKIIFKRNRPLQTLDSIYFDKNFHLINDRYSFPSGHASTSFNVATSIALRYHDNPALVSGFYLQALIVSFGRIYTGAHYPMDVLTGALVGSGTAILAYSLRKEIINAKATLFNELDRKEIGSDKVNQYVLLGSLVALDFVYYFILGQESKITKNMHIGYGSTLGGQSINLSYSF